MGNHTEPCRSERTSLTRLTATVAILATVLSLGQASLPVLGLEAATGSTDHIVDRELEILKLNTKFRIANAYQSKFRTIRQFAYNFLSAGFALAGSTVLATERWATKTPDPTVLEYGSAMLVTGQGIIQGGILTEAFLDKLRDRSVKKKKLDPESALASIKSLQAEIDELLSGRQKELAPLLSDPETARLIEHETRVLELMRDLSIEEFARFYAERHSNVVSRNVSYLNGLVATGAGGYCGSLMGLLTASTGNKTLATPSGIGFVVSSSAVMASPFINRYFTRRARAASLSEMLAEISCPDSGSGSGSGCFEKLQAALDILSREMASIPESKYPPRLRKRHVVYKAELELLSHQLQRETEVASKADRQFAHRALMNTAIAAPKLAWGTMLIYSGSALPDRPFSFNKTVASAATVYTVSNSLSVVDAVSSIKRPRSQKFIIGGQVPLALGKLDQRLLELDTLDALVDASK
ncbi:MAG: hypothetical protein KC777_13050 [Cyanobacteria bacterium HKST-UBA02]|nr:hypothetical protein [Cyanobacteria bacterium HKST-UBA02]